MAASGTSKIIKILQQTSEFFRKFNGSHYSTDDIAILRNSIATLKAEDVGFDSKLLEKPEQTNAVRAPVVFVKIYDDSHLLSTSIFGLREGSSLPLHDHPGMSGIIKCIHGSLEVKSFTKVATETAAEKLINEKPNQHINIGTCKQTVVTARLQSEKLISCEDDLTLLLEPSIGNIHSISAVNGPAAFIDFLSPPYDSKYRCCHYYQIESTQQLQQDSCYTLREIGAPDWYWCEQVAYYGPQVLTSDGSMH